MAEKITKERLRPVYYIYGPEEHLADRYLADIKSAVLAPGFESFNCELYYRDSMDASAVVASAETLPAFADYRVVVVKGAGSLKEADRATFLKYLEKPSETTVLVFMAGAKKPDMRSSFVKLLNERGYLLECRHLRDSELVTLIKREAKLVGKRIGDGPAARLVEIAGPKSADVLGELEKISLFVGDKAEIELADVEEAGLECRQETIFKLSDAIGSKDLLTAMNIYQKISNEQPLKILSAITREVRVLLKIKLSAKSGVPRQGLAKVVGVPPWTLNAYMSRSARFTEAELERAIGSFRDADMALKTGRIPQPQVIKGLIVDLCRSSA